MTSALQLLRMSAMIMRIVIAITVTMIVTKATTILTMMATVSMSEVELPGQRSAAVITVTLLPPGLTTGSKLVTDMSWN